MDGLSGGVLNIGLAARKKVYLLALTPDTSLLQARDKRDEARKQLAAGIDPGITRKIEKTGSIENTFKAIAEDFLMTKQNEWSVTHHRHIKECFERDVYPWIGNRP